MDRIELLERARECVCGQREEDYGTPEDNFSRIAGMWSYYLGMTVEPKDVAAMMALLKLSRIANGGTDDCWIDLAGYAACGAELIGGNDAEA